MEIRHSPEEQKFCAEVEGGEALLNYRVLDKGTVEYLRVFVPPEARGQGAAELLTSFAFDYAVEKKLKVVPTCPYISKVFLKKFAQYQTVIKS